jgi:hypothetical protein
MADRIEAAEQMWSQVVGRRAEPAAFKAIASDYKTAP